MRPSLNDKPRTPIGFSFIPLQTVIIPENPARFKRKRPLAPLLSNDRAQENYLPDLPRQLKATVWFRLTSVLSAPRVMIVSGPSASSAGAAAGLCRKCHPIGIRHQGLESIAVPELRVGAPAVWRMVVEFDHRVLCPSCLCSTPRQKSIYGIRACFSNRATRSARILRFADIRRCRRRVRTPTLHSTRASPSRCSFQDRQHQKPERRPVSSPATSTTAMSSRTRILLIFVGCRFRFHKAGAGT